MPGACCARTIDGREAGWDEALDLIAGRFARTIAEHGPDAVAFYVSGQFLTEDYYVANKLMKGFIGSANIDTNSRLCMASSVAGHVRAFGEDVVPGCYDDIEEADLVVLVGSNMAWCHPVLYQRLAAAKEARGTRVVVIDPRRTATLRDRRSASRAAARQRCRAVRRACWCISSTSGACDRDRDRPAMRPALPRVARRSPCRRWRTSPATADLPVADLAAFYDLFAAPSGR